MRRQRLGTMEVAMVDRDERVDVGWVHEMELVHSLPVLEPEIFQRFQWAAPSPTPPGTPSLLICTFLISIQRRLSTLLSCCFLRLSSFVCVRLCLKENNVSLHPFLDL